MPAPEEMLAFRVPKQLVADLLAAEQAYLAYKANSTRTEFLRLSRALLSAMEEHARRDAEKARLGG